ncbi:MAG: flippase-like domain-containing protein [Caldilinea sp.]|nr:flippase-like domain-containing protein [Caldilinea sp.]
MNGVPSTAGPVAPAPAFSWRRVLLLLGLGLITCVLLVVLFGGEDALAAVRGADARWLALAFAVHYSSFAVRGHRWQRLLAMIGYRLGYLYTTGLLLAGWFVSALLPARAGDFMRIGVLRLDGRRHTAVPVAASLGSIVLERALDILAIVALGALFGFAVLRNEAPGWLLASYAIGLAMLLLLGVALLVAPPLLAWMRRWFGHRLWQSLVGFAEQLASSLRVLFRQPGAGLLVTGESLYIWLCDALVVWFVTLALGASMPFSIAAFVALTVDVLAAVPLTPGGVGQIDAAYAGIFALLPGVLFNVGAAVLLIRFITYWSFLAFTGLVTFGAGFGELLQRVRSEPVPAEAAGRPTPPGSAGA